MKRSAVLPALILALAAALPLALAAPAAAQEHPEHPKDTPQVKTAHDLTVDELADAIARYVEDRAGDDGRMTVHDPVTDRDLELSLVKVHRERVSKVAPDTYFACTDFRSPDGTIYDLDLFMQGTAADTLEFDDLSIHKVAGQPRYTWHEEGGIWKKKPVDEAP